MLRPKYLKGTGELGKKQGSPESLSRFNIHNMKKWLYLDSTISRSSLNGTDTGHITASNIRELNGEIFKKKLDGGIMQSGLPEEHVNKGRIIWVVMVVVWGGWYVIYIKWLSLLALVTCTFMST